MEDAGAAGAEARRARYVGTTDEEALDAFRRLTRTEGIIPALEPSHAVAWLLDNSHPTANRGPATNQGPATSSASPAGVRGSGEGSAGYDLLTLSGRGDKDLAEVVARPADD